MNFYWMDFNWISDGIFKASVNLSEYFLKQKLSWKLLMILYQLNHAKSIICFCKLHSEKFRSQSVKFDNIWQTCTKQFPLTNLNSKLLWKNKNQRLLVCGKIVYKKINNWKTSESNPDQKHSKYCKSNFNFHKKQAKNWWTYGKDKTIRWTIFFCSLSWMVSAFYFRYSMAWIAIFGFIFVLRKSFTC